MYRLSVNTVANAIKYRDHCKANGTLTDDTLNDAIKAVQPDIEDATMCLVSGKYWHTIKKASYGARYIDNTKTAPTATKTAPTATKKAKPTATKKAKPTATKTAPKSGLSDADIRKVADAVALAVASVLSK